MTTLEWSLMWGGACGLGPKGGTGDQGSERFGSQPPESAHPPEMHPHHLPVAFRWCEPRGWWGQATAALWKHQYIDSGLVMDPVSLTSVLESTSPLSLLFITVE